MQSISSTWGPLAFLPVTHSDLFEKIRDTNGTLNAKIGTIKDRNGMDLTEAEDIKKRWQENTELYKKKKKKILMT